MTLVDDLVAACKRDREILQDILENLESGALIMKSRSGLESSWVDTTEADIERYKRQIADLDDLISRHLEAH